jgi:hypothetical protein
MEAVRTSETSVDNHFTRQYNPEDSSEHHTRRRENLKSHRIPCRCLALRGNRRNETKCFLNVQGCPLIHIVLRNFEPACYYTMSSALPRLYAFMVGFTLSGTPCILTDSERFYSNLLHSVWREILTGGGIPGCQVERELGEEWHLVSHDVWLLPCLSSGGPILPMVCVSWHRYAAGERIHDRLGRKLIGTHKQISQRW